jgi:cytoskeletal protein CcmA (bactofilin family)
MWKVMFTVIALFAAQGVQAVEFVQAGQFISGEPEVLREELWISADTVTISGEAQEDLFLAGSSLDLRGTFLGDVWGAGNSAIAAGVFSDNVRLAARLVQVSGAVRGSLTAAGNTVKIEPSAAIAKDMLCLGENVISEGSVAGNVRIMAQKATIGGKIAGDVSIAAQDIVVLPDTVIGGDLIYTAPKELVLSPSVQLGGELVRKFEVAPPRQVFKPLGAHFLFGTAALLAGMVFCGIFPRYTAGAFNALRTVPGVCMLTGAAALFLIPMTAFLLLFTFIGLPLSILLILAYLILLYLSKIAVGLWLGALILRRTEIPRRGLFGTLALGLLIVYALTAVDAASLPVHIVIAILGLGALILALFRKPVLIIQTSSKFNETKKEG